MTNSERDRTNALEAKKGSGGVRVIRANRHGEHDPAEPWELPAGEEDLRELATRRFERLPHRPATLAEVPTGAIEDLRDVVGEVGLEQLFVIPRSSRTIGAERGQWVLTPAEVVAVGADTLAVWIDDADGPHLRATLPFADVVAMLDRSVLLYGRLEIIGPESSIVVRYNTVGQPELRSMLRRLRRATAPVGPALPEGIGHDPGDLPHKWMALLRSGDVLPRGMDRLIVAAGDVWNPKPHLHDGVAVLSSAELVVATDPTPDAGMAHHGVDLLAVARRHVRSIGGSGDTFTVAMETARGPVEISMAAHPSLVAEATAMLGPLIGGGASLPVVNR